MSGSAPPWMGCYAETRTRADAPLAFGRAGGPAYLESQPEFCLLVLHDPQRTGGMSQRHFVSREGSGSARGWCGGSVPPGRYLNGRAHKVRVDRAGELTANLKSLFPKHTANCGIRIRSCDTGRSGDPGAGERRPAGIGGRGGVAYTTSAGCRRRTPRSRSHPRNSGGRRDEPLDVCRVPGARSWRGCSGCRRSTSGLRDEPFELGLRISRRIPMKMFSVIRFEFAAASSLSCSSRWWICRIKNGTRWTCWRSG